MNKVIFTGDMTIADMVHEHPAELEDRIRKGEVSREALANFPEWLAFHPQAADNSTAEPDTEELST